MASLINLFALAREPQCGDSYAHHGDTLPPMLCERKVEHLGEHQQYSDDQWLWTWSEGSHGVSWKSMAMESAPVYLCAHCGVLTQWTYITPNPCDDWCFSCDLWRGRLANIESNQFIIDGELFSVGDGKNADGKPKSALGYGGRYFEIEPFDSPCLVTTNDLWYGGKIPKGFEYKNTAEFVND